MMKKEFITTAAKTEYGHYDAFQADRKHAYAWGVKAEDIDDLKIKISDNQSAPDWNAQEYWGWLPAGSEEIEMIFPNYKMFHCCFPYGVKAWEEAGKGKAYRLEIVEINGKKINKEK